MVRFGDDFLVIIFKCCIFWGKCGVVWFIWFCINVVVLFGFVLMVNVIVSVIWLLLVVCDDIYSMFLILLIFCFSGVVIVLVIIFGFVLG